MKEVLAIVRMKKTGVTKKALIDAGVAGFTVVKATGRGKLLDESDIDGPCKEKLLDMAPNDVIEEDESEEQIITFLDDARMFPRRLFTILAYDEDIPRIVEAIMAANHTERGAGDGKIFITPVADAIRVRTGESGDAAIW